MEFTGNNKFTSIYGDLTKRFQKECSINECHQIIQKDIQWKYVSVNPSAPTITGLIKIQTVDSTFWPTVNWTNAPVYKLAKMLSKNFEIYSSLLHKLNIKNTMQLTKIFLKFHLQRFKIFFFWYHEYIFVTTGDKLTETIEQMHNQNVLNKELRWEIIKISTILMKQNCFQYRDLQHIQEDGLAMGAPTSSFFS